MNVFWNDYKARDEDLNRAADVNILLRKYARKHVKFLNNLYLGFDRVGRNDMNTRQMQYVIAVAETRSFSEAAAKLMISQPSLSQYIAKIEEEMGVQIFERSVPLKMTYAGEIYVKTAKKILMEEAEFQDRLSDLKGGLSGKLKIGSGYLNAVSILPGLVAEFQKHFPNVQVEIYEETEPKLKLLADEGDLDLVIATSKFDSAAYEKVMLGEEAYLFAVPKIYGTFGEEDNEMNVEDDYPKTTEFASIDLSKLQNIPIIRLQPNTYMRELVDSLYDINHIKPRSTVECTTAMGAYNMAKAGVGAALISYSMYKMDNFYNVNYYEVREIKQKRQIFFVYNKSKYLSSLAKKFISIGQKYYKNKQ